jgi:hypothetical protein
LEIRKILDSLKARLIVSIRFRESPPLMVSLAKSKPWLAEGVSRATWFRRQKGPDGADGRTKQAKAIRATVPVVDKAWPRNAATKASDSRSAEMIRARVAAIGSTAVMTKTGDRLDVITSVAWKARQKARSAVSAPVPTLAVVPTPAPVPAPRLTPGTHRPGAEPSRGLATYHPPLHGDVIPPPRSMIADGGIPARPYPSGASIAEATALIRAHAAQQSRVNEDMARRLAALERSKAETDRRLEAIEQRRAGIVAVVQGLASMFSLVGHQP